jgi:glucose/arabinose dehydrogenase/PKD repeat protein
LRRIAWWGAVSGALVGALVVLLASAAPAANPPGPPGVLTPGASATAGASAAAATLPTGFQDSIVWSNLSFPTAIRFAPDGRIFIAQKGGKVLEFDSLTDTTPTTVIDLSNVVDDYWDRGLLGLAIDPNFPTSPYLYVLYAYDAVPGGTAPRWNDACPTPPGPNTDGCVVQGRLSRLTLSGNVATNEQVLIQAWCQQFPSHSVGDLHFGQDGALYVSGGEGASFTAADYGQFGGSLSGTPTPKNPCGDPPGTVGSTLTAPTAEGGALRSQSLRRNAGEPALLNGAVLRVDPATGTALPNNPLASSTDANARRIVAYGMRNPFRFTIRPGTNDLWIGDVGWNTWEEINRDSDPLTTVSNFGWPCYEGVNPQPGYQSIGLNICNGLYSSGGGGGGGTFGDQTIYTSVDTAGQNLKEVASYTATAGNVTKISGYLSGLGATSGTQNVEAVIYANSNGAPGTLLGVSSPVTITAGRGWGWVDFTFPNPVSVSAGTIWMGYIASGVGDLTQMRYLNQAGAMRYNVDAGGYSDGPSNPFGTATSSNKHYSLYATLQGGTGPAVTSPLFTYNHNASVVSGDGCPTGGSSVAGLAFYTGGTYPTTYNNGLFFEDHTRGCIWFMKAGTNGLPDPSQVSVFEQGAASPVDLETGPGGDLFYADFDNGAIHRIKFLSSNRPPNAVATGSPTSGPTPLTVNFDGSGSSDPDGDPITYSWDLNGDGTYGDSTAQKPSFTYTTPGTYTVRLRVTDSKGASSVSAPITINAGNNPPVPTISSPLSTFTWKVGDPINFSGSATDQEDGTEPASRLSWTMILHHCFTPTNCHTHIVQTFNGVASGTFNAPDHEYPCWLEIQLTATDSTGATATTSVRLDPQIMTITVASNPTGANVGIDEIAGATPLTKQAVIGSTNSISATSPQTIGGSTYTFSSWSDGGAATHNIVAPATDTTYTATFTKQTSGTFGTTTIGSSIDTASINLKEVSKYTAVASNVTKLTGYISGLGAASGSQKIKAIIYADNGSGHPGALLGVSNEVTVTAGQAWNWVDFNFASPVAVQSGTIWMGYIASSTSDLTQLRYDNSPSELNFNVNSGGYAAGPTNPFGTPTLSNKHYSLYATYTTPGAAVAHMTASRG